MTRRLRALLTLASMLGSLGLQDSKAPGSLTTELTGTWIANPSHNGETSQVVLYLEAVEGGLRAKFSTPAIHVWEFPVGPARVEKNEVRIASLGMALVYDPAAGT
ncbi:MAG TPA: hypothetical protein VLO07_10165, partial [Thermoanaerobaculia bacterium]|nr:hypothetical protein [Thermoanaerobaculia bacterium]